MFDVITFGSATQDIYLNSKKFLMVKGESFDTGEGMCLAIGSKMEIEDAFFFSGGGGTNAAATFANQGFKVAYCGMVGEDSAGDAVIKDLVKFGTDTALVKRAKEKSTNTSVLFDYPGKDRTVLVYRGASDVLKKKDIPWQKLKGAKWFYLAPFSGELAELTEDIVDFAKENGIKTAFNPGYSQLNFSEDKLRRILKKTEVLILNREEASKLTGIPCQREREVFKKIDEYTANIAIMTKGGEGVVVSDGQYLYRSPSLGIKCIDGTGAGDAFGSGFVAGMMEKNDIVYAIQFAMANSSYSLQVRGAKEGLLKKGQKWEKVKVEKESCLNGVCL
ncbi:MAG: carbohydrate kinase family protein [Candidatus Pacebacteria bacterium]|nr:carbohydrate kinase family protein [Candidatus Paceibacterota bacterium]